MLPSLLHRLALNGKSTGSRNFCFTMIKTNYCCPPSQRILNAQSDFHGAIRRLISTNGGGKSMNKHLQKFRHFGQNFRQIRVERRTEKTQRLKQKVAADSAEEIPAGLLHKLHYYFKRYWYIALPVHLVTCSIWFGILYAAVRIGLDVVAVLKWLHLPESWVKKVEELPKAAGAAAAALILYKIITPLRYATSIIGIRMVFVVLKRHGYLKTSRELHLQGRLELENMAKRLNERRRLRRHKKGNGEGNGHAGAPTATKNGNSSSTTSKNS